MATTVREVERKLRVHGLFRLPELSELPGIVEAKAEPTRDLTAVYHDTADLRLFRAGITLRRREGGNDAGWHLKLPVGTAGDGVRDEIQLPLSAGKIGEVPDELADLVTAHVREEKLVPVATLKNKRAPYLLTDEDGTAVVELTDDRVSVLDGREVVAKFREIEVEAVDSENTAILSRLVDAFVDLGAEPTKESKAATALGPAATGRPDVEKVENATPSDPASQAIRALLAKHVGRILVQDVRVRRDLPDSVHQMRVAARRLRSGLQAFRPLLDKEWANELRTELKWIAGELSGIRDTEVMIERLEERATVLPPDEADLANSAVEAALRQQFTDARVHALAAMRSQRYVDLLVRLVDAVNKPRLSDLAAEPCSQALPPLVEKTWKRLNRDVKQLRIDSAATPWHETRIAAKKARYSAEAAEPVFGEPVKRLVKALESVTEILGDHQDAHVAQMTLRAMAADVDGASGFALGLLYGQEIEYEMALREEFTRLWPTIVRIHKKTQYT
ncbi:MAG: CYTH and CHAD domain-containing protein [Actinobacteria bacterium]|nr:CYTH and CHAD domain-containing protein [Actinomycetota bacterium]